MPVDCTTNFSLEIISAVILKYVHIGVMYVFKVRQFQTPHHDDDAVHSANPSEEGHVEQHVSGSYVMGAPNWLSY